MNREAESYIVRQLSQDIEPYTDTITDPNSIFTSMEIQIIEDHLGVKRERYIEIEEYVI